MKLLSSKTKAKYNCTQSELYAICTIGWNSYIDYVAQFTNLKSFYTLAYAQAKLQALNNAKNLPDYQGRNEPSEIASLQLQEKGTEALTAWQTLKSYIESSFPKNQVKAKLQSAGSIYYRKASNFDWENLDMLLKNGNDFINNNTTQLTNNDNMPATFPTLFSNIKTEFETLYTDFKTKQQQSIENTEAKTKANNEVYDDLIKMFKDGQLIMRKNVAIRKRFVFAEVKKIVTPDRKVLTNIEGKIQSGALLDLGLLPTGAKTIRIKNKGTTTIKIGLSKNGIDFDADTVLINATVKDEIPISNFNSTGNRVLIQNQSTTSQGSYKVEVLG